MSLQRYLELSTVQPRGGFAARFSDLALVACIVAVVALMILPLPTLAIDVLVAINMCFGVLLLLTTLYIATPLDFSAFPSVLLVTTLFRLSLSIATTRMILLEGEGGHIIETFGEMVVGGNLVVGLVVFLIITVVQFIVIAKGAERVAEVAARFSLDAMPGKQLSIDSDLRSGLLDKDEARRKRKTLELESKLHGSLDGAMKFVKGDAIAGIVIVIVNLIGGLAIGVFQANMEFGAAVERYSVLTIGDGLIAQIPALLSAIAAGMLVTRTTDEDRERNLGEAIHRQLSGNPRVLLILGGITLLLGLVPGFPAGVFAALGVGALLAGAAGHARLRPRLERLVKPAQAQIRKRPQPVPATLVARPAELKPIVPLLLQVETPDIDEPQARALSAELTRMLDALQYRIGLPMPRLELHLERETGGRRWRLLAFEVVIGEGPLSPEGETTLESLPGAVRGALRRQLGIFLGTQEATNLLNRIGADYPEVVKETVRALPTARIAEVLRRLIEEEVPLRNMRDTLEAMAEAGAQERDPGRIADMTRVALKRYLVAQYARDGRLAALVISADVEELIRGALRVVDGAPRLAMEPSVARALIDTVKAEARAAGADVLVTSFEVRRPLRKLIEGELFDLPVLAFNELAAGERLDVVGQLRLPQPAIAPAEPAPAAQAA